jgi:hypothetical protein
MSFADGIVEALGFTAVLELAAPSVEPWFTSITMSGPPDAVPLSPACPVGRFAGNAMIAGVDVDVAPSVGRDDVELEGVAPIPGTPPDADPLPADPTLVTGVAAPDACNTAFS